MREYKVGLVPGPTSVPPHLLQIYASNLPASDLEPEFFEDYEAASKSLQQLGESLERVECLRARRVVQNTPRPKCVGIGDLSCIGSTILLRFVVRTQNDVVIMTGEGMVALWGALKSVLKPGDKVLAINNGIYGEGVGNMAKSLGAEVIFVSSDMQTRVQNADVITAIHEHRPVLVTMIHCETPSGIINSLEGIGAAAHEVGALFYVDFVSSAGGVAVHDSCDSNQIDLGLLGSQKVLSSLADMSVIFVSKRAWAVVEEVAYPGYDALLPFKNAVQSKYFPYTPSWQGVLALKLAADSIIEAGTDATLDRHRECAKYCRERILKMGLELFVADDQSASPTVTSVVV
jgi:aspartate aminotransferase-like enzyme